MPDVPENPDIDALAAQWVARADGRTPSAAEERALKAWLRQDARHLGAYVRARAISLRYEGERLAAVTRHLPLDTSLKDPTRRRLLWAAGGALAAGIAGVGVVRWHSVQEYSTRLGEMRREPLADGSALTLNTGTSLKVSYTNQLRQVTLLRGEVLIEAAADATRPFALDAFGTRVLANAAAFSVRALQRNDVQVLVQEGQVQVLDLARAAAAVTLPANTLALPSELKAAQSNAPLIAERIEPAEVERRLAWQRGQLSFEDVALSQALLEFARYSDVRIVIDDPTISDRKVVGLFSANDPIGFARTVAISLGLRVDIQDGVAHLKAA